MEERQKVVINLYDLSGGMAKVFSPAFLGKQIEGIWHTGVCIYGKEYYFGGGICSAPIKQTPYGTPIREITVGEGTEVPEDVFNDFLQDISSKYTMDKYDLFNNNCNNFTDDCVHFLVGENIPEYISGLPTEVLNTPIGQMLKPIIDNMQNQVVQQSGSANMFPQAFEGQSNNQQMFPNSQQQQQQPQQSQSQQPIFPTTTNNQQNGQQNNQELINNLLQNMSINNTNPAGQSQEQQIDLKNVTEIDDFMAFIEATSNCKACVINFYSKTCGPCKMIKPIYANLSEQYKDIKFYLVDGQKHQDISSQFELQGFPTFITFFDSVFDKKWVGANQTKLMTNLNELNKKILEDKKKKDEPEQKQQEQENK